MENAETKRNILSTPIQELGLSEKTCVELNENNIKTLGDIAQIRMVPPISSKSFEEVLSKVVDIPGFRFGMTEDEIASFGIKGKSRILKDNRKGQ